MKSTKKTLAIWTVLVLVFVLMAAPVVISSDDKVLSEAKKALDLTGFVPTIAATIPFSVDQTMSMIKQARPGVKEEDLKPYREALQEEMEKALEELSGRVAVLYAKHYSLPALEETNRFYSTPVGKQIKQGHIDVSPELAQVIHQWSMETLKVAFARVHQK